VTGPLGNVTIALALLMAAVGAIAAFAGGALDRPALRASARNAAYAMFALVVVAFLAMEYALVTHDFSVEYVSKVGSRETPLFYTIISLWSSLEGSILLWALILSGFTLFLARWSRKAEIAGGMPAYSLGAMLVVNTFFLVLIAGPANPFGAVFPVPENGPGPNPLLQNHPFMGIHPPLLYTGYVGMALPFALTVGALVAGRVGRDWSRVVRRWTLVPWGFLSLGIIAGGWWSYEVLGWGGYWAWDPVENASFMPWLTGTAFLHSVMVQERREMLKTWTVSLIIATFVLTLLGTFLTRSGVLLSVHAFADGPIGLYFLVFMGLVIAASLVLLVWRGGALKTEGSLDSPVSRETAFLLNNLAFAAFAFVVLLGTLFPLLAELFRGVKVSVGEPYFNRMNMPLALLLVLLAGIGPALPWRRGTMAGLLRSMRWPAVVALIGGVILYVAGVRETLAWLTFALAILSLGLLVGQVVGPARARRAVHGERIGPAALAVIAANRRRYGGYLVHAGVLVIAVGIAASSTYRHEEEWTLRRGEAREFQGYSIQLDSVWAVREPHRDGVVAGLAVATGNSRSVMQPRLNYYRTQTEPIATPAVRETMREDLYLVLAAYGQDGSHATLRAIVSPLVLWIWIGGGIIGLGVIYALLPNRKRSAVLPSSGSAVDAKTEEPENGRTAVVSGEVT
jgi:cytochrome c-type biogenesis protein CcmF